MKNQSKEIITIKVYSSTFESKYNGIKETNEAKYQLEDGIIDRNSIYIPAEKLIGNLSLAEYIDKYKISFERNFNTEEYINEVHFKKRIKSLLSFVNPQFNITRIKLEKIDYDVFRWIRNFHNSYTINNLSSMKQEMGYHLKTLRVINASNSLKILFECFCLYYLNKKIEAKKILEEEINNGKINHGLRQLAESFLNIINSACKISKEKHTIAFITSVRSPSDYGTIKLILSSSKEYVGDKFNISHFKSIHYKNINELLTCLPQGIKYQHIIFIGHASRGSGKFSFRNCKGEKEELQQEDLKKFTFFLEKSKNSSIFMFTCNGDIYLDSITNKANYIYTKESSNNPEEEIYCAGFYQAYGCGTDLFQSHEAGKLALRFRSKFPISCEIKLKSSK